MSDIEIILGTKEEFPKEYIESFLSLWQKNNKEELPVPPPPIEYYRNSWQIPRLSYMKELLGIILNKDHQAIGYLFASWKIKYDNLDQAFVYTYITSEWDKEDIRKQALKTILSKLPTQIKKISTWCELGRNDEVFLKTLKEKHDYEEIFGMCELNNLNKEQIKKEAEFQRTKAKEKGYNIIFVDNARFFDIFDKDEICVVFQSIWNDMPRQELSYNDEIVKPERIEEDIKLGYLKGDSYLSYFVIQEKTGKPIGYTTSQLNKYNPWLVWQWDTGIIHEHRGNGLGIAVKYQMLERLIKEKETKYWITGSNVNNSYMRNINKKLGYKEYKHGYEFEFLREELEKKLST